MKISCGKDEFVKLVEACHDNRRGHNYQNCSGCIFCDLCTHGGGEIIEGNPGVMDEIKDALQMEGTNIERNDTKERKEK